MDCEICERQTDTLVILPIRRKNGALQTLACEECSRASGRYCLSHDMAHGGYEDDTSLCHKCLFEMIAEERVNESEYFRTVTSNLAGEKLEDLNDWLDAVEYLTKSRAEALLRALAIRALRDKTDIGSVVRKIVADKTAYSILPEMFR